MKNIVYLLHEFYTPSHYKGLQKLVDDNGYSLKYCEIDIINQIKISFRHPKKWIRVFHNLWVFFILLCSRKQRVLVAIAPYNSQAKFLKRLLSKHIVFMHGSWSCWDGSKVVHVANTHEQVEAFDDFVKNSVIHFFAVSQTTKKQLVANGYKKENEVSIVNHSYDVDIVADQKSCNNKSFIYVGRITESKGIQELLNYFESTPEATFTIVGSGNQVDIVKEYVNRCPNIIYKGYISGLENIIPLYKSHSFLLLNSKRTKDWEELFGMTLFESMACGCIPIATDHPGPMEVITNNVNGFICKEGEIVNGIIKAMNLDEDEFNKLRDQAIQRGADFSCDKISKRWSKILDYEE